jgi:hypothetical protein
MISPVKLAPARSIVWRNGAGSISRVLKPLSRLAEGEPQTAELHDATRRIGEITKENVPLREKARRVRPLGFRRPLKSNATISAATGIP